MGYPCHTGTAITSEREAELETFPCRLFAQLLRLVSLAINVENQQPFDALVCRS